MQATGDLVAVVVELTAGMQFRERDFRSATLRFMLVVPFDGRRNATSVVNDRNGVVGMNRDFDMLGKACERFVDRVVDDFVNQMVQTRAVSRIADVHTGTFPNGFEAFEDLNAGRIVGGLIRTRHVVQIDVHTL